MGKAGYERKEGTGGKDRIGRKEGAGQGGKG